MFICFDGKELSRWEERYDNLQCVPLEELPVAFSSKFTVPGRYRAMRCNPKVRGAARFSIQPNGWESYRYPAAYTANPGTYLCKPWIRCLTGKYTITKRTSVACTITLVKKDAK